MNQSKCFSIRKRAEGYWPEIIKNLLPEFTEAVDNATNHVPCPIHGGKDGFRFFDDWKITGGGICNTCGSYSDGFKLLVRTLPITPEEAFTIVQKFLKKGPFGQRRISHKITKTTNSNILIKKESKWFRAIVDGCSEGGKEKIKTYLESRGLTGRIPFGFCFHPSLGYYANDKDGKKKKLIGKFPAIVAKVYLEKEVCGVHVTYLAPDGKGKAQVPSPKKLVSRWVGEKMTGGTIHVGKMSSKKPLVVCEGIETGLAIHEATDLPVFVATSAVLLERVKLPDAPPCFYIAADLDLNGTGQKSAGELANKLVAEEKKVHLVSPEGPVPQNQKSVDWLDVLNHDGPQKVATAFKNANPWELGSSFATPSRCGPQDGKISFDEISKTVQKIFGFHLLFFSQNFFKYEGGFWQLVDEDEIKNCISKIDGTRVSGNRIKNTLEVLKAQCWQKVDRGFPKHVGLLNGDYQPFEEILHSHKPDHWIFNQVPIELTPDAQSNLWEKTLREIFVNDSDCRSKIELLQDWFGYCLVPETKYHKFLWLVGRGANGKSLILKILTALVGRQNVSHVLLNRLDRGPMRALLFNKLVNISSEMNLRSAPVEEYLKSIVSGDEIDAEEKFKTPFSFRPFCRLVEATNDLPPLQDLSTGFSRRAIILPFNRSFSEDEQDRERENNLLLELPGIFNWALKGLRRLTKRDSFQLPPSSKKALQDYILESDPVQQFALEKLTVNHEGKTSPSKVYAKYQIWSTVNGLKPLTKVAVGKRLKELGFEKRKTGGREFYRVDLRANH